MKQTKSLRSNLGRVRGLGSAGHGTEHWWLLRVTSFILIPLSLYVIGNFFVSVIGGGYSDAILWLRSPFSATLVILFLGVAFHHAANGLQVVIEDYIHCEGLKLITLVIIKFLCAALAILGTLATVKVLFGV